MEKEEYEYDNNLSFEANVKLKIHHEIYEDVKMILQDDYAINNIFGVKSKSVSDEQLEELKTYTEQYLNVTTCGILRTVLINLKPFKENNIIKETYQKIIKQYEKSSK
jgi:hypothetical protein